jgi:hypothetical protein
VIIDRGASGICMDFFRNFTSAIERSQREALRQGDKRRTAVSRLFEVFSRPPYRVRSPLGRRDLSDENLLRIVALSLQL